MKWWRSRISIAPPICLPRSRAGWNQTPTSSLVNRALCDRKETGPRQTARGPELVRSYDNLWLQHQRAWSGCTQPAARYRRCTSCCRCCRSYSSRRHPSARSQRPGHSRSAARSTPRDPSHRRTDRVNRPHRCPRTRCPVPDAAHSADSQAAEEAPEPEAAEAAAAQEPEAAEAAAAPEPGVAAAAAEAAAPQPEAAAEEEPAAARVPVAEAPGISSPGPEARYRCSQR